VPALTNPQSQLTMLTEVIEERSRANSRQAMQHELGFSRVGMFSARHGRCFGIQCPRISRARRWTRRKEKTRSSFS
jgi:hypothetical protein